ncbi:CPBP family intramembrane metalloprotease [Candidatus Saccharibacteria bacterium]|nr:CPBP family intramembrane metalloprotease [Candidatus Saccharibacteria bacterium]
MTSLRSGFSKIFKIILSYLALLIWVGGVLFIVQFLMVFPFTFIANTFKIASATLLQTLYSTTSYLVGFVIIVFVPFWLSKRFKKLSLLAIKNPRLDLGLIGLPTWTDLGLAPIAFIAYTVAAAFLTNLFSAIFPWFNATETQNVGYDTAMLGPDRALAFFVLVLVAPIVEELIFRGFLYPKLKSLIPAKTRRAEIISIIIATLLTSLLFAIMHGQWNVGVNVFVMSIALCTLREITGSTYAGILMHIIKNLVAFYILFIAGGGF